MTKNETVERRSGYHHGDLRGALIMATRQLIEEKGIDHFSVADACRLAGVSTAAPYKHFKNKDEMVEAAVMDAMLRHRDQLLADLAAAPAGRVARVVAMGRNYVEFAQREPVMFQLRFSPAADTSSPIFAAGEGVYAVVQEEVRAALDEDSINDRVAERSFMLWSFVHGLSYLLMLPHSVEKRGTGEIDALLEDVARRVLAP